MGSHWSPSSTWARGQSDRPPDEAASRHRSERPLPSVSEQHRLLCPRRTISYAIANPQPLPAPFVPFLVSPNRLLVCSVAVHLAPATDGRPFLGTSESRKSAYSLFCRLACLGKHRPGGTTATDRAARRGGRTGGHPPEQGTADRLRRKARSCPSEPTRVRQ